jgi:hypothetical protein
VHHLFYFGTKLTLTLAWMAVPRNFATLRFPASAGMTSCNACLLLGGTNFAYTSRDATHSCCAQPYSGLVSLIGKFTSAAKVASPISPSHIH